MSKIGSLIGNIVGEGSKGALDGIAENIDRFVETKDEKREALQELTKAQIELNKQEAKHRTIFVAGWRPFIGWVCGSALAYNFVIRDIMYWVIINMKNNITAPPALQMEHLITILLGLLGLGGLRTYEKRKGLTK